MTPPSLDLYTIYERPSDFPGCFVVRRFRVVPGNPEPQDAGLVGVAYSLRQARQLVPPGLACLPAEPADEPQVVETWL